jgi:hypothetical protein
MRGGLEIVPQTLGDDRDQAKLQIGTPTERFEEKILRALNRKGDGIGGRDNAHK